MNTKRENIMAQWTHKIDLNEVIGRMSDEHDLTRLERKCPKEVKDAIAAEIEKASPIARFGPQVRKAKSIAEVTRVLADVFDAADRERVWCGF